MSTLSDGGKNVLLFSGKYSIFTSFTASIGNDDHEKIQQKTRGEDWFGFAVNLESCSAISQVCRVLFHLLSPTDTWTPKQSRSMAKWKNSRTVREDNPSMSRLPSRSYKSPEITPNS